MRYYLTSARMVILKISTAGVQPQQDPSRIPSRDTLRMNGISKRESKGERKRLIFLGLHRKPIKPLTRDLLCSWRPQVPVRWSENSEHFLA